MTIIQRISARPTDWTRCYVPIFFAFAFFLALTALHHVALHKAALSNMFMLMTDRTIRNIALIEHVDSNRHLAFGYFAFCTLTLLFMASRRHPLWATWATLIALAAPWILYLDACLYIFVKLITF